jgi:hypothetical protein
LPAELQNSKYETSLKSVDEVYTELELFFPQKNYRKTLYFKDGSYISPVSFHTRNWPVLESQHFRFFISNSSLINDYSIQRLENFLQDTMDMLEYSLTDRELLTREKIDYVLCKDAEEIEEVTGFNTRGIYLLAQDCVVSIFNSHYHELAHLLLNFKLRNLPLYTHPFLQEGFAVAIGGRGGKEPDVILDMGKFLVDNAFLSISELLTKEGFYSVDASLSYPVCGLYNRFLMQNIGMHNYLELYLEFSDEKAEYGMISATNLPSEKDWKAFLKEFNLKKVWLQDDWDFNVLKKTDNFVLLETKNSYCIRTKGSLLVKFEQNFPDYRSSIFHDKLPKATYVGEKYMVLVSPDEVMIYNLFTNNLIADYASGFTLDFQQVPQEQDYFVFYVDKDVFDEDVKDLEIQVIE